MVSYSHLDHLEDEGVLSEDPEHVKDAGHNPGLHSSQTWHNVSKLEIKFL